MTILSERNARRLSAVRPSRALHYLPVSAFALDVVALACAGVVAGFGRKHLTIFDPSSGGLHEAALDIAPFLAIIWLSMIALAGGYKKTAFGDGTDEFRRVLNAGGYAAGILGAGLYLAKYDFPRGFYFLIFLTGIPLTLLGRLLLRRALHSARARGALQQRVVIAGGPAQVDEIATVLRRERWLGYHLVGALVPEGVPGGETDSGIPVLGNAEDPGQLSELTGVDVIFFTGGTSRTASDLRRMLWELEAHDMQLVMAPQITDMAGDRIRIRPAGGLPLVHMEAPRWQFASRWAKRTFDLIGSSLLIAAFSPLLGYAALRVKLHDSGPVFFRQTRVGRHGEEFGCFKFRTMVVNAEAMVAKLQEDLGVGALLFKMKDDPRITKPGRWLRRFSVDELPQLFNVFIGHMSLVGPRPQVAREVALYDDALRRRLKVRPGMTGLWQVSGRNDLSVEESARLDLYYVDNWSMTQDVSILFRTFGAVVGSKGAY